MFSVSGLKAVFSSLSKEFTFWALHGLLMFGVTATIHLFWVIIRRNKMLEGKEVDVAIGKVGHASLDINDKLEVEISVGVKIDLLAELHKLAEKSGTKLDDVVVAALEKLIGKAPAAAAEAPAAEQKA